VSFEDAALVWNDPLHLVRFDRFEAGEERWHALGQAGGVLLIMVVHTYPGDDDLIRIISARKATRAERRIYENEADESPAGETKKTSRHA
jgi:uncharacterized DUF497 family protein